VEPRGQTAGRLQQDRARGAVLFLLSSCRIRPAEQISRGRRGWIFARERQDLSDPAREGEEGGRELTCSRVCRGGERAGGRGRGVQLRSKKSSGREKGTAVAGKSRERRPPVASAFGIYIGIFLFSTSRSTKFADLLFFG
jgi:hypothetical protein